MSIRFIVTEKFNTVIPNTCFLEFNNWDDYSIKSQFDLFYCDQEGKIHRIGTIKIGLAGFKAGWIKDQIPASFEQLDGRFFSLGQDEDFYKNIMKLELNIAHLILNSLNDISFRSDFFEAFVNERSMKESLLRFVSITSIREQFRRILSNQAPLTKFNFSFIRHASDRKSAMRLDFAVTPYSKPSTNIHVLIGRNGVGKTTVFDGVVNSIIKPEESVPDDGFLVCNDSQFFVDEKIPNNYFSRVLSVSFSAFDPFIPPPDLFDVTNGTGYYYIGIKNTKLKKGFVTLKDHKELREEAVLSLLACFSIESKKQRWAKGIEILESDNNFQEINLRLLAGIDDNQRLKQVAHSIIGRMSSGHMTVLLTFTRLVELVEEKTLVLMDEPECHLHPPLLSALIRAISDLLIDRNAVALIATHSPVILQEVPKECVWKLDRTRLISNIFRPELETFGENVGVLTREVFGLEVSKSGFHNLLQEDISSGKGFEEIVHDYRGQLGFEGKAILKSLIVNRDRS